MKQAFARFPLLFAFLASPTLHAQNTVVTFDNGWEDWTSFDTAQIEPDGGNPDAHVHYELLATGISLLTNANPAFLGNFSEHGAITLSVDVRVDSIMSGSIPGSADLIAEFRSYSLAADGQPYASVWFNLALLETGQDWATYTVTFNPTSPIMPAGWRGTGAIDPEQGVVLPEGVTFADIMANVEELLINTFTPGQFFSFKDYNVRFDNVRIEKSATPPPHPRYDIVDVGDFGGELANAFDINDNGDIVGTAEEPSLIALPFLSRGGGELIYLGSLTPNIPFGGGLARGISANGYIVGTSVTSVGSTAFLWSEDKGMINVNAEGNTSSTAWDVNSSAQVVGQVSGPNGGAFLWTEEAGLRLIGLPGAPAGFSNIAEGINEAGQICGHQWNTFTTYAAWVYDSVKDTYRQLPGLGGISQTYDINDAGYVVGMGIPPNNQIRPLLWTADGELIDLGFLPVPDFTRGKAYAINNHHWIVGSDMYDGNGVLDKGWLWIDGNKVELRTLIDDPAQLAAWSDLSFPLGINNHGEIVGIGMRDGIPGRPFLMRPISKPTDAIFMNGFEPEPARH